MLSTKLGPFTVTQAIVLVVAFAAAASGSFTYLRLADGGSDGATAPDEQLVPAQIGDLITTVSTDGSLVFPVRETAAFESSGTVGEVFVAEGDTVSEGQALAGLDAASVLALEIEVAQARLDLQEAREDLADATADASPLTVATAEAKLAGAMVSLQEAQEEFDALTVVVAPDPSEVTKAEAAVANAQLAVRDAEESLADLTGGPSQDAIDDAGSAIAAAITELANAEGNRALVAREQDADQAAAFAERDAAVEAYAQMFVRWLGVDASLVDPAMAPADLLAAWDTDLDALFRRSGTRVELTSSVKPPLDDPATVWHEPTIFSHLTFIPTSIVGTCEDSGVSLMTTCVQLELDTVWAALDQEQADVAAVMLDASKARASADSSVADAASSLEDAEEVLAALFVDADPLEVGVAEADLAVARSSLDAAKAALAELTSPAPADSSVVASAAADLTVAQADVVEARESLAELTAEPDPLSLALLQSEVTVAEFGLEAAVSALEGATLRAPIGGEIASVDIEAGSTARGEQAAGQQAGSILIVDRSVVEIEGAVDEVDILAVGVGVSADVTMTALPGETLAGTVTDIGSPSNQQGVVTFPVTVRLEVPDDLELIEGLTATASIVTSEVLNVLLVPTAAVQGSFVQPFVRIADGGTVEERPVELGASDDFWVVVRSGVAVGEVVAVPAPDSGEGFATFGGGFGGGATLRAIQGGGRRGGGGGGGGGN